MAPRLKRLGFRAIADKAAQLPAILREIEGHGVTGELKLPDIVRQPAHTGSFSLPARLNSRSLRAAFDLVSSLHFIGDQNGAAHTALAGLTSLVHADRWTIYLVPDAKGPNASTLEAIASLKPGANQTKATNQPVTPRMIGAGCWREWRTCRRVQNQRQHDSPAAGMGANKKKERKQFVVRGSVNLR